MASRLRRSARADHDRRGRKALYRDYIACLNEREWHALPQFVAETVRYNHEPIGYAAYRDMLIRNCDDIPDPCFRVGELIVENDMIASRLLFDCTPAARFMGLPIDGRRISFAENVFYRLHEARIAEVWSIVDKAAIEDQIARR